MDKQQYTTDFRMFVTSLGELSRRLDTLEKAYFAKGFDAGGSDPITDEDVSELGLSAADVGSMVTMAQQVNLLLKNGVVTRGDYNTIILRLSITL